MDREVPVDADLMEQAFYALITNAIDASPRGGRLRLKLVTGPAQLRLHIEDEGPGLEFKPQPQDLMPGPTTKRRGTGLGIPVAYKIAEAHGWRLSFERPERGGTRAVISLGI
jgi:signal transduction histidine kinase